MWTTYEELGRQHEADLERDAARAALARVARPRPRGPRRGWARPAAVVLLGLALAAASARCSTGSSTAAGTITTVVGTGEPGTAGRGGAALETTLQQPVDVAVDQGGNLYVAERFGSRILKADPSGRVTVVAGGPETGFSGDGGPARKAKLAGASAVAVDADGHLYISDSHNNRVRMVDGNGVIRTVVGTGRAAFGGDGGLARNAALSGPGGLAFDVSDNLYIADLGNRRIRRVDRTGVITTVAGTESPGFSPDGTLAAAARLGLEFDHLPLGLAFDHTGSLLFVDYANRRIRSVDAEGRLRTAAGNGEPGASGDGGPATKASLEGPLDVAVGADGSVYISVHDHGTDAGGQRIRRVAPDGTITTIAGTGKTGYAGDHGPATEAELNIPSGIAIGPDGDLYVADADNHVIRKIDL